MVGVFGAKGYEIVRYNHMRGENPTSTRWCRQRT